MKKTACTASKIYTWLGVMLILCAAALTGYHIWSEHQARESVEQLLEQMNQPAAAREAEQVVENVIQDTAAEQTPEPAPVQTPVSESLPDGLMGRLDIPSLELKLPVWDSYSEELLKQSVCRFGEGLCKTEQLIIAGHNYRSHFGPLARIAVGDTLTITDREGEVSTYAVTCMENVGGNDLKLLLKGDWDLTLFTCSFGGSKRLLVRCEQI